MVGILDLYCGMGGLSLGLALSLEGAEILGLDIDRWAVETYNLNLSRLNCRAEIQDVLSWEPRGDFDVVVGGPPCFPPDTPIVVNDDLLARISELKKGEKVVTHEGRARGVTEVFRRPYKGRLVSLKVALLNIPIRVTPNHPFLAYRPRPCHAGVSRPCTPACLGGCSRVYRVTRGGKMYEYVRSCMRREGEVAWVGAGYLRPSWDFVALKIPRAEPPPDVPKDPELWYLFGLYVTEGSAHARIRRRGSRVAKREYVAFYLGKHERDLIERVKAIATRRGWRCGVVYERTAAKVYVWSADFHRLVLDLFGKYADGKRVPLWVLGLPSDCRTSFLQGVRDGDGDKEKFVTTVNPIIAFAVWLLALSLGLPASLSRVAMKPTKFIEGRVVHQSPYLYKVREIKRKDHAKVGRFFFSDDYVWLEVKRVDLEDYEGDVYNLEVEEDHTYLVWGVVVHNCQPFSLANTKRRGEEHPLFPTFPRFFDAVLALRPRAFLLENVKGLTLRPFRHYLEAQLRRASEHYRVWMEVLDASRHGVPQRRERLFVVGLRRDVGARFEFPKPTHAPSESVGLDGRRIHRWLTLREAVGDLMALPPAEGKKPVQANPKNGKPADLDKPSRVIKVDGRGGDMANDTILIPLSPEQAGRILRERLDTSRHWGRMAFPDSLEGPCRTLSSHTVGGTKRETIVLPFVDSKGEVVELPWTGFQSKHPPLRPDEPSVAVVSHSAKSSRHLLAPALAEHVMTELGRWATPRSDWGSRVMREGAPAFTITEKHRSGQLLPVVYRRLTVRECLRVQSFPDWWRFPEACAVSRRYKLVGEAVPPILAYRLGVALAKALGLRAREPPREGDWALPYFRRAFADYFSG